MYSTYILCSGLPCAILILWYYFKLKFSYWRNLNVKYLPPIPLFGNVAKSLLLLNSYQETYQELYKAIGDNPYAGYYEMSSPVLMVKDPQLISKILVNDFKHFQTRDRPFLFTKNKKLNPLSLHLGSVGGERWKFLRQALSPVFTSVKIKQMQEKLAGTMHTMDNYLNEQMNGQNSIDIELRYIIERLTMHLIISNIFGIGSECFTSKDEFVQMMRETFEPKLAKTWHKLLAAYCPIWLSNILNWTNVGNELIGYFKSLALDSVEHRRLHGVKGNDIIQVMIDLQNSHVDPKFAVLHNIKTIPPNEKFDELDIAANSFLFFMAGYETTTATMVVCLYELALNQDIQDTLRSEVQQVQYKYKTMNYDSLKEMPYLDAIIAETVRKYPPVIILNRVCTEDYVIPDTKVRIPAGTNVMIPVWSIHHDWKNYQNPEMFDPERFIGDNKQSRPNGAYFPFGSGPRFCLGKRFAELQLKAAISAMVLKYDIKPCAKTDIPLTFKKGSLFLHAKNGIWINLSKRQI